MSGVRGSPVIWSDGGRARLLASQLRFPDGSGPLPSVANGAGTTGLWFAGATLLGAHDGSTVLQTFSSSFAPPADNTRGLGFSGRRWARVWAAVNSESDDEATRAGFFERLEDDDSTLHDLAGGANPQVGASVTIATAGTYEIHTGWRIQLRTSSDVIVQWLRMYLRINTVYTGTVGDFELPQSHGKVALTASGLSVVRALSAGDVLDLQLEKNGVPTTAQVTYNQLHAVRIGV